jgi:ATP-dependent DNA helicase PIF1
MSPSENLTLPFKFKRKEFLVHPSFAMTNNKAWKQTLPNVGVYISQPMLSHA